jgi:hypothetical protein
MVRRLITRLIRVGWRRGLLEGSRGWLVVGVSATAVELTRRLLSEKEERATLELHTGDAVEVRVQPSPR